MKISIFGLGYVGSICLAGLSKLGHKTIGVDIDEKKVNCINKGISPVKEPGLDNLISKMRKIKNLVATTDAMKALIGTDISFICVGTPSSSDGELDLQYIFNVAKQIGEAIKTKSTFHTIIVRSTVKPGTNKEIGRIIQKISLKKLNQDFAVVSNPEFLREGTALADFFDPGIIVMATEIKEHLNIPKKIYEGISAELFTPTIDTAELIKYVNNSFHALKVAFANEIGSICKALDIDSHELMKIFIADRKLNISPYYLKPGLSYGGSCLPKDLRALQMIGAQNNINLSLLNSVEESNTYHIMRTIELIKRADGKNVSILGLAFKKDTDDLRQSPIINIASELLKDDYNVRIYDHNIKTENLLGENLNYLINRLPFINEMILKSEQEIIIHSQIVVITNHSQEYIDILKKLKPEQTIIDLVKIDMASIKAKYCGICW